MFFCISSRWSSSVSQSGRPYLLCQFIFCYLSLAHIPLSLCRGSLQVSAVSSAGVFCPKAACPSPQLANHHSASFLNPTLSASILLIFDRTNVLCNLLLPVTFILLQTSISLQIGPSITTTSILDFSSAAALLRDFDLGQVPKSSFVKSCSFRSSGINSFLCSLVFPD